LFEKTGDPLFQQTAEKADIDYIHRIDCQIITNQHDLGFLYSLSTVADYKITGNRKMKDASIDAAETLLQRFWEKAGVIQAWG
ncbi:glucuronyl hydrolase, partial [Enterococcus faecium]